MIPPDEESPPYIWDRKSIKSTFGNTSTNPALPQYIGVTMHEIASDVATCLDVILDFSSTNIAYGNANPNGIYIDLRIFAQVGSSKVIRASYSNLYPGSVPSLFPVAFGFGNIVYNSTTPNLFLIQGSGIGAYVWGVELAVISTVASDVVSNLFVGSICHGFEQ